jgi:hypothetical protein
VMVRFMGGIPSFLRSSRTRSGYGIGGARASAGFGRT